MLWSVWPMVWGTNSAVSVGNACPSKRWYSSSRESVTWNTTCALLRRRTWLSWSRWSIFRISSLKGKWGVICCFRMMLQPIECSQLLIITNFSKLDRYFRPNFVKMPVSFILLPGPANVAFLVADLASMLYYHESKSLFSYLSQLCQKLKPSEMKETTQWWTVSKFTMGPPWRFELLAKVIFAVSHSSSWKQFCSRINIGVVSN